MRGRSCCIAFVCILLLLAPLSSLEAQWIENGVLLNTSIPNAPRPAIIPDGEGGAIIAYVDNPDEYSSDIMAQRVDARGNILWSTGGVAVCSAPDYQFSPRIIPDGAGGAIIIWSDYRGADSDVYAQRIDSDGNPLWTSDGAVICDTTGTQSPSGICSDGEGGAIICWSDRRDGNNDLYAQKIDSGGVVQWAANGVAICDNLFDQGGLIASDGRGGAFFVWSDDRNGDDDIFLRAIDADGVLDTEEEICVTTGTQSKPDIIPDGEFGAFIAWQDSRSGESHIYAQRVDMFSSGMWGSLGVAVCTIAGGQQYPKIAPAAYGGLYVTWADSRNSGTTYSDIYFQKLSAYGNLEWTVNGVQVCIEEGTQWLPKIVADGDGGAIIAWDDRRNINADVYAQRFSETGGLLWGYNGVPVVSMPFIQQEISLTSDGSGGAIFAWDDTRSWDAVELYVQRIERNGYWGYPSPSITAVRDVPGDQGGYLNLAWDASYLDPWPDEDISEYSVWRAISETQAALFMQDGRKLLGAMSDYQPRSDERAIRMELVGGQAFYWEEIAVVDAAHLETYSLVVPTLFDSTGSNDEYHYFQVIAHGIPVDEYWISAADSARSVDNLAPAMPMALTGDQSVIPEGLELTWDPNREDDLANYRVYRGLTDDFTPGPGNLIASPSDTTTFDDGWRWDSGFFYKVSAVDIHGNESQHALLGPSEVTGEDAPSTPPAAFLGQNFPNPFNPVTTIRFGLAKPSHVSLRIYDAAGRLVRVLVDERMDADRHEITWNGLDSAGRAVSSGIYFYSLIAGEFKETRKMVLLR
jgi:hypothetical protein